MMQKHRVVAFTEHRDMLGAVVPGYKVPYNDLFQQVQRFRTTHSTMTVPKLFTPIKVADFTLQHRVVLAPLTRLRAQKNHAHSKLAVEYYKQRASTPGTLLIAETTIIAPQAGGYPNMPGIWSDEQVAAWKDVGRVLALCGSATYAGGYSRWSMLSTRMGRSYFYSCVRSVE